MQDLNSEWQHLEGVVIDQRQYLRTPLEWWLLMKNVNLQQLVHGQLANASQDLHK